MTLDISASIILLTYNQETLVEEALLSLLRQDVDNLEIIISDDCSQDRTWPIIQAVTSAYQGPKKIVLLQNQRNIGLIANFSAAAKKSSGNLIFIAAGDDVSAPQRCSESIRFWRDSGGVYDLVAADGFDMAYDGRVLGLKQTGSLEGCSIERWFSDRPFFFGASHMISKRVLELAPLNSQLLYEDQTLVFRALLMGGATRLPVPLVYHRRGGISQPLDSRLQFQVGARRFELICEKRRELIELTQFLQDARILNKVAVVQYLESKILQVQVILGLLINSTSLAQLNKFWRSNSVTFSEKWRYTRYYLFYPFVSVGHAVRDTIRLIKHKAGGGR